MTAATEPWYVPQQRIAKADKIATTLRTFGATAEDVVRFTDQDRRQIERDAGVRRGSDTTWRLVAEMLAGSSRPDALCPTCGIGDPHGEPGPRKPYNHTGACAK